MQFLIAQMSDKTAITEDYQKRFLWIMQRVPVTITLLQGQDEKTWGL